jgi:hypothetical protein
MGATGKNKDPTGESVLKASDNNMEKGGEINT